MNKAKKNLIEEINVDSNEQPFVALENLDINVSDETPKVEEKSEIEEKNVATVLNSESLEKQQEEISNTQKQKFDEYEQTVSKKNSKKSKIINIVFFVINIAVVAGILAYQISKEPLMPLDGFRLDVKSLVISVLLFGAVILIETFTVSYLLKVSTGKWRLGLSYKTAEIGRYYDNVTPLATGGQPFQITYLKNRGVALHTALSVPLAKYIFHSIAWIVISLICLIVSGVDKSYGTFVSVMSIIGFILSSFVVSITLFLCVCKKVGKKLVVKGLKLLYKMKIIKNYDKQYEKITKYISDFQDVMKQYASSPKDFIIEIILNVAKNFVNYAIPFFVVKTFVPGLEGNMFIKIMVMCILVDLSSSFFPMPGGTGLNEISFSAAFATIINIEGVLVWVLLLWRFFSYYIYLVQGICILSYDMVYGNKKYKWQVRKENLAEESKVFKQEQINKFRTERAKRRKAKNKYYN